MGFSFWWLLLLWSTGLRALVVATGFMSPQHVEYHQISDIYPLHWLADSYPLDHQRIPGCIFINHYEALESWNLCKIFLHICAIDSGILLPCLVQLEVLA